MQNKKDIIPPKRINTSINKNIIKLAAFVFWIILWQIVAIFVGSELLVPSPLLSVKRLISLSTQLGFWLSTFSSLARIITGFIAGVIAAMLISALTSRVRSVGAVTSPMMTVIKSTPVASFIILALVWMARDGVPIFISFLMVLPIMWQNINAGIDSIDNSLSEMVTVFQLPFTAKLRKLYIPSVLPYFKAGCVTSIGLAWKAGVAAEVLCTPKNSIGRALYESKIYLETPDLFAWTMAVIILSLILENLLAFIMRDRRRAGKRK